VALNSPGYQSLALGYLRAYAQADRRLGGKVAFQTLDLSTDVDPWWVAWRVLGLEPDVLGISVTCWNARAVFDVCRIVGQVRPECVIVLGGPEVGPIAEDVLAAHAAVHAVVRGEGEATFADLLHALAGRSKVWRVEGVTARKGEEVVSAPDRALIADLDSIPSPYLAGVMQPVDGGAYLETYRGCPHACAYCFEGKGYGRIRSFSDARIASEIDAVAGAPGVRSFSFIDPVFNLTNERLAKLAGWLAPHAAKGARLHTIEVDIERIDDAAATLLRSAGVASVETGPQTIAPASLAVCHRRFDPKRFASGVRACKAQGIAVECDLIAGLPAEDVHDFLAGLRFALDLDPGIVQSSTLHVLPGTDLWARAAELGLSFDRDPPHEIIATPDATYRDLRRAEVLAHSIQKVYRARM
ncbi:MAG: B12-binding domain-containing radical SAM protein, partial [Coriobacteriia bacterium]|nr:B12-binding domain-containing radical SAM protein [Coriobacteriia bacterium]